MCLLRYDRPRSRAGQHVICALDPCRLVGCGLSTLFVLSLLFRQIHFARVNPVNRTTWTENKHWGLPVKGTVTLILKPHPYSSSSGANGRVAHKRRPGAALGVHGRRRSNAKCFGDLVLIYTRCICSVASIDFVYLVHICCGYRIHYLENESAMPMAKRFSLPSSIYMYWRKRLPA